MIPMMGMGAMNSELMNKLGGRKKPSSPEPKPESSEPSAGRSTLYASLDMISTAICHLNWVFSLIIHSS
jgi:hypothetical protein